MIPASEVNWVGGLIGGATIGLAASMYLYANGRIAGISGIASGLLDGPAREDFTARLAFVVGLVLGTGAYVWSAADLDITMVTGKPGLVAAGLCVGIGTRLGAGCTSGHGVCGLARRSRRSLVATAAFMAAGFVTVYVVRHLV